MSTLYIFSWKTLKPTKPPKQGYFILKRSPTKLSTILGGEGHGESLVSCHQDTTQWLGQFSNPDLCICGSARWPLNVLANVMKHTDTVNVCACSFRIDTEFFPKGRAFSETIFNNFLFVMFDRIWRSGTTAKSQPWRGWLLYGFKSKPR